MKFVFLVAISMLALVPAAQAQNQSPCRHMTCNNNPTCQQLRNAGKCAAAQEALRKGTTSGGNRARY